MTMTTTDALAVAAAIAAPTLPADIAANARELDDIRDAQKVLKKREDTLRKTVLDHLESVDKDAIVDGDLSITVIHSERSGVDTKRLEALHPRVYNDVKTSTPVTRLVVDVKGK